MSEIYFTPNEYTEVCCTMCGQRLPWAPSLPVMGQPQTGRPYAGPAQPHVGQANIGQSYGGQPHGGQHGGQQYGGVPQAGQPYAGPSQAGQPAPQVPALQGGAIPNPYAPPPYQAPPPSYPPGSYPQGPYPPNSYPPAPYAGNGVQPASSSATGALICGILAVLFSLLGILGTLPVWVLGGVAIGLGITVINNNQPGRNLGTTGIVLGSISLLIWLFTTVYFVYGLREGMRNASPRRTQAGVVKRIVLVDAPKPTLRIH